MGLCQRDAQQPAEARRRLSEGDRARPDTDRRARRARRPLRPPRTHRGVDRSTRGAACARSGAARDVSLGLAYSKAGQPDRAVVTLRQAAERYPEPPPHLRRARARLAGDGAGPSRSSRVEQGARSARESGRRRTYRARPACCFGRALLLASEPEPAERLLQQATAKAAGRSAGVLLPGRRRRTPRALRRRAPGARRLHRPRRRRTRRPPPRRTRRARRRSLDAREGLPVSPSPGTSAPPRASPATQAFSFGRPKPVGAPASPMPPARCSTSCSRRILRTSPRSTCAAGCGRYAEPIASPRPAERPTAMVQMNTS